jgi:hypothetical protein
MRKTVHDGFNFASPLAWWKDQKPKPTTFLPHSQKQHLIVTQNELKHHE